ncbi:MAG: GreA/GreB family elongation factor [Planctomycetes bacterium]|nr:GreA/GreB family elongation factor [Planctomycetota bacterium]
MGYDQNLINRIQGAARARDIAKVEEIWLDLQGSGPVGALDPFLDAAREVADRGEKEKAAELLLLLRDDLKGQGRDADLLEVMRRAVLYSARMKGVRDELVELYRKRYGERPGFEVVLSRTGLLSDGALQEAVKQLDQVFGFDVGDFVFHARGWGVGKVVECYPEAGEFVIDFARNRGARMEAGMAMTALQRRSADDLDVMLWTDKDRVRRLAEEDPLKLLKSALESSGGKLQARDLREKLTDILDKGAWTKFWGRAKKAAKDDPRLEIGPAPRSIISLREAPVSRDEEVAQTLKRLRGFAEVLETARRELVELWRDERVADLPPWLAEVLETLKKNHGKTGTPEQRACRLELALLRDEVASRWPQAVPDTQPSTPPKLDPDTGEVADPGVSPSVREALEGLEGKALPGVLKLMVTADYRRRAVELTSLVLERGVAADTLVAVLLDPAPQTWDEAVLGLKRLGREEAVIEASRKVFIKPTDFPDAYAALARLHLHNRGDILGERTQAEFLAKVIQLLDAVTLDLRATSDKQEKAQLKGTLDSLRAILNDKGQRAIGNVIENGTEDDVRRILQLVRQSPSVTPTVIRATENFVVHRFPELLATVVAAPRPEEQEQTFTVYTTAEGKRRREQELHKLLEVDMPQITIEIGKALEFGDISENAELDAARERQQRLADQVKRIQQDLERAVVFDPASVETDEVRVGTRVVVDHLDTGRDVTFTILGPWDLDDEDSTIVSHLSPVAQGILGKAPGEQATVRLPDGSRAHYRVKTIERAVLQQQH